MVGNDAHLIFRRRRLPDQFVARIAAGPLRQRYLARWLEHDLPTRWLDKPTRIQFSFTLFLHDRPADA